MIDIKDYWVRKEAEIGETIDAKFYCRYLNGDWSVKGPRPGVLFFSRSTLFFQSFYSPGAVESMLRLRQQDGITESHSFKMPLNKLKCTLNQAPQNLLSRMFAKPEQSIVIHFSQDKQNTAIYQFGVHRSELEAVVNLINA